MTTNGTSAVAPVDSIDSRLGTEHTNGDGGDLSDLDSPDSTEKKKFYNSPEITCSPSPCVFDWDKKKIREITGNHNLKSHDNCHECKMYSSI